MRLLHLALPSRDVLAQTAFYEAYFGFKAIRGPGFLTNADGFVLVLDPFLAEIAPPAQGLHAGFQASAADVRTLFARMASDSVPMDQPLEEANGQLSFYCRDPAGYQVEVRALPT